MARKFRTRQERDDARADFWLPTTPTSVPTPSASLPDQPTCAACGTPIGGGPGGYYALDPAGQERCDQSKTGYHEAPDSPALETARSAVDGPD